MQKYLVMHFQGKSHKGSLENISMEWVDKTDVRSPKKTEDNQGRTWKTYAPFGVNVDSVQPVLCSIINVAYGYLNAQCKLWYVVFGFVRFLDAYFQAQYWHHLMKNLFVCVCLWSVFSSKTKFTQYFSKNKFIILALNIGECTNKIKLQLQLLILPYTFILWYVHPVCLSPCPHNFLELDHQFFYILACNQKPIRSCV